MNQDNNFQQYGFDHYDQVPMQRGFVERVFGPRIAGKMRSPLFATGTFLLAGVAFAAIIISSYPSSEGEENIPVVQADAGDYKQMPSDPGGMQIENRDSTIFMSMRGETAEEGAPIENLLDDADEQIEKLEEFARQIEEAAATEEVTEAARQVPENLLESVETAGEQVAAKTDEVIAVPSPSVNPEGAAPAEATPPAQENLQVAAAPTTTTTPTKPVLTHKAGESPETLEFVKSVLDKKDGRVAAAAPATRNHASANDAATRAANIQPAAGAMKAVGITPGEHYVQLASVTSMSGAEGEWGKLQKSFSQLAGMQHRVQAADLGERGIYYRIQAGPMSKESADALCGEIKAQKPGGCLVTR